MSHVLVLAHRGYSGKYPENTLRAFREALALAAPAIELDVHLSKDLELVVTHDFMLGRCVKTSTPQSLSKFTAVELAKMDAGSFKGEEFKNEIVSKLSDILLLINHQCLLNIEIKEESLLDQSAYETMTAKLLSATQSYGLRDVVFSSFDPHALKVLRSQSKEARIALLDDRADQGPKIAEAKELNAEFYNVNLKRVTFEQVALLHQAGLKVLAYTAKTPADLELAQGLQVNGVFADNLEEALKFFAVT